MIKVETGQGGRLGEETLEKEKGWGKRHWKRRNAGGRDTGNGERLMNDVRDTGKGERLGKRLIKEGLGEETLEKEKGWGRETGFWIRRKVGGRDTG